MTERDQWMLRGPVRVCRVERTWYSRQCGADTCETEERTDISTVEFRADGSILRYWHRNPDGSEWTTIHTYSGTGRLMAVRAQNGAGPVDEKLYEYDPAGRLVGVIARSERCGDRVTETYDYDAAGRMKKTLYVDLAAQNPNTHYAWGVQGTDTSYSAPGAATLTTLYNEREQPIELLFSDVAGRLLSRVDFTYDSEGRLVDEAKANIAETLSPEILASLNPAQLQTVRAMLGGAGHPIRRMHRYDAQGRRVETRSQIGPISADRMEIAYNDQGDQSEVLSEHDGRDYGMDGEGHLSAAPIKGDTSRSETRFRYDYDPHGNWVTKTVEGRWGTDQDFTLSTVERRTIEYFE